MTVSRHRVVCTAKHGPLLFAMNDKYSSFFAVETRGLVSQTRIIFIIAKHNFILVSLLESQNLNGRLFHAILLKKKQISPWKLFEFMSLVYVKKTTHSLMLNLEV